MRTQATIADYYRAAHLMRDNVPRATIAEELDVQMTTLRAMVDRMAIWWLHLAERGHVYHDLDE